MTRYEAFINRTWREAGIADIVVARIRGSSQVEIGLFLVDWWCLGAKDAAFLTDETEESFAEFIGEQLPEDLRERIHPACAKKLIEGAVAYAERLGFAPHRDYRKARRALGGIDAQTCTDEFTFGKDGKPFFVAGESDSPARINQVIAVLRGRCGEDGFDYLMLEDDDEDPAEIARENLLDFFDAEPPETSDFFEFSGMITAMFVCLEDIHPLEMVRRFWGGEGRVWENNEEFQEFADDFLLYWNAAGARLQESAQAAPADAWPLDVFTPDEAVDEEEDAVQFVSSMASWCSGFIRATSEWPEAWDDALTRADLAPHWALIRAYAHLETPENAKFITETLNGETPELRGQTLPLAIVALYRALRPGRAGDGTP